MWDLRWLWLLINDSSPKDISPGKLSTWKSLPVKEQTSTSVRIQNSAPTQSIQCEIIPRCRYRRQTLKVFVIKIFVLLGPQRPAMPFLTYAYFHYSDIKQTETCCCCCRRSAVLSLPLSSVSLAGCESSSPREYPFPMSPWGRRPEDMLWGCIEGCCGRLQSCISQYEQYR